MGGVFENLKRGWQCGEVQKKKKIMIKIIIMPTNKYLNNNEFSELAKDNFLHNIRPGQANSTKISKTINKKK